jgi:lipopolysaccharide export system permease protein
LYSPASASSQAARCGGVSVASRVECSTLAISQPPRSSMLMLTGDFEQLAGDSIAAIASEKKKAIGDERRYRTEIHSRFSMAASCFFFTRVGGPFAMLQARRQFITTFIICFLPILIIDYPVMFLMVNLCKTGSLEPWWAVWVSNAILCTVGIIVLRKVVQH